jgi:hypothetical protein
VRSTRSIEILCLALAALVLVWSGALIKEPWPVSGLLLLFALAIVAFRARRFFPGHTRARLSIESWSMVIFITGVLWLTGKSASPLFNLYLLPIILSALTLGRLTTLIQVGAIASCHVLLAAATPGLDVISLGYASQAVGQLAPFLLVAYLTTTLSADITEARERIENLAQTDSLTGIYTPRTSTKSGSASMPTPSASEASTRCSSSISTSSRTSTTRSGTKRATAPSPWWRNACSGASAAAIPRAASAAMSSPSCCRALRRKWPSPW